jgi:hypothetical protein
MSTSISELSKFQTQLRLALEYGFVKEGGRKVTYEDTVNQIEKMLPISMDSEGVLRTVEEVCKAPLGNDSKAKVYKSSDMKKIKIPLRGSHFVVFSEFPFDLEIEVYGKRTSRDFTAHSVSLSVKVNGVEGTRAVERAPSSTSTVLLDQRRGLHHRQELRYKGYEAYDVQLWFNGQPIRHGEKRGGHKYTIMDVMEKNIVSEEADSMVRFIDAPNACDMKEEALSQVSDDEYYDFDDISVISES